MKKYCGIVFSVLLGFMTVYFTRIYLLSAPVFSQTVKDMGYYDVSENPAEIVDVTIPMKFDSVYERYNNLLKEGGYDLTDYKGKKCKRYTYLIPSENARANILVYNGKIIGGDICSITIDGIMKPLEKRNNDAT